MKRNVMLLVGLTACFGGCGAPKAKGPVANAAVGVFTSASDCAESHKLSLEECDGLLQAAVAEHQQSAKTFISLRLCEVSEGADNCERTEENAFRPRMQAFLVTFSTPPSSQALYAGPDKQAGFNTINKGRTLLAVDETLTFSASAKFVAEGNVH